MNSLLLTSKRRYGCYLISELLNPTDTNTTYLHLNYILIPITISLEISILNLPIWGFSLGLGQRVKKGAAGYTEL